MADLTEDGFSGLARIAGVHIPDEDLEPLTMRFNALLEALEVLERYPLDEVTALN